MNIHHLLLSAGLLAVTAFPVPGAESSAEITGDTVYELMLTDYEGACAAMQKLRQESELPLWELDLTEGDLHFNNGEWRLALKFYTRASEADEVRKDDGRAMELMHRRISCFDCLHDDAQKTALSRELFSKAKEAGSLPMQSIALFNIGKTTYLQENKESGYALMAEAVQMMEKCGDTCKLPGLNFC